MKHITCWTCKGDIFLTHKTWVCDLPVQNYTGNSYMDIKCENGKIYTRQPSHDPVATFLYQSNYIHLIISKLFLMTLSFLGWRKIKRCKNNGFTSQLLYLTSFWCPIVYFQLHCALNNILDRNLIFFRNIYWAFNL